MTTQDEVKSGKAALDELVKQSDILVATPETIEKMQKMGYPIGTKQITYGEYLDNLFAKRRAMAGANITKLPMLEESVSNATVTALYEEMKECFILGIPGAAIILALILLELSLKYKIYRERLKQDPNCRWDDIEALDFRASVVNLRKRQVLSRADKIQLDKFNDSVRNMYIHYKIKEIIDGTIAAELPEFNVATGKVVVHKDVDATKYPSIWFSAKRAVDRARIIEITSFSVDWVNKLLGD